MVGPRASASNVLGANIRRTLCGFAREFVFAKEFAPEKICSAIDLLIIDAHNSRHAIIYLHLSESFAFSIRRFFSPSCAEIFLNAMCH